MDKELGEMELHANPWDDRDGNGLVKCYIICTYVLLHPVPLVPAIFPV